MSVCVAVLLGFQLSPVCKGNHYLIQTNGAMDISCYCVAGKWTECKQWPSRNKEER